MGFTGACRALDRGGGRLEAETELGRLLQAGQPELQAIGALAQKLPSILLASSKAFWPPRGFPGKPRHGAGALSATQDTYSLAPVTTEPVQL